MNKWPGAPFLGSLHPSGEQNTLDDYVFHINELEILWTWLSHML